ncbi:PREDICTED: RNA polymerase II C-terminal domain phosphatase-like 2 isoform X1 [Lupinus angustifolius]|uniref:RNA polymerase II C-terminal domain phosphatase-like 2 isoform X1 n=1 Tax=Lupinus angustifolius TaxID=3871 RepID=UPI00092F3082|nr:PREDICTED: RNA polymerase II C-terminal domain phosphatase-like 2 isoform X1 [Lupinus angustifolius]
MNRLGTKTDVYDGFTRLGEIDVVWGNFQFPNNEIRIRHVSPKSDRCPPLSVLQTISPFSVRCKLESSLPIEQPLLLTLHASCFHELKTAVAIIGDEEIHLVAMPSKRKKFPCFWCYSVPKGLYNACLGMLNMRCLSIVFDLDETLIVANTMKSFEDRIDTLRNWLLRETDPLRVQGMSAELKRYLEDRLLLKQYTESDCIVDNGKFYRAQMEEVPFLSNNHDRVVRPVLRMQERNIVLTRINPEIRDTSVLVRLRPAWEDLRCYLTAKGRKRFEVYVCTMAEREYALEIWRLLDPGAHLIGSKQILDRVICVKSGSRKSLLNVFQNGICHPKMAMVIDDRSNVWEDKDQPRVHVVPAFTPYYAPQAETSNAVPVLCVARNVACNVRGCFFKEFDENLLQRVAEIFYEDEIASLPHPPDVSNYLMSEFTGWQDGPNGSTNAPTSEGMNAAEVERRLNQPDDKSSVDLVTRPMANSVEVRHEISQPTAGISSNVIGPGSSKTQILSQKPGLLGPPLRHDGSSIDRDHDMKKGLLAMRHGPDIRGQSSAEPPLISRPPTQASPLMQPVGGSLAQDDINSKVQTNNRPFASVKESNIVKSDKHLAQQKSFSLPNALPPQVSIPKTEEPTSLCDSRRQNLPFKSQLSEDGTSLNHASSNSNDFQNEAGKSNFLPSLSMGVLQEIAKRCSSKVEFKTVVSTSKELQFSVEVIFTGERIGTGMGKSRKDAQQQAAENALRNLAEKYVAHVEPQCRAVDNEFDKLSLGNENGFVWDAVNPESSELQRKDEPPKGSVSEASVAETRLNAPNAVNLQMEKRIISPRLSHQPIPNKRLKE